jgi:hypothetical protein
MKNLLSIALLFFMLNSFQAYSYSIIGFEDATIDKTIVTSLDNNTHLNNNQYADSNSNVLYDSIIDSKILVCPTRKINKQRLGGSSARECIKSTTINLEKIQNEKMKEVFFTFQSSIIDTDCALLITICSFPIEGEVGFYRLFPNEIDENNKTELNEKQLLQNCQILDSIEIALLKSFDWNDREKNNEVYYEGCYYRSNIFVNENLNSFQWSVGCEELENDSIGEYSIIFTFTWQNEKYKLSSIHGAG